MVGITRSKVIYLFVYLFIFYFIIYLYHTSQYFDRMTGGNHSEPMIAQYEWGDGPQISYQFFMFTSVAGWLTYNMSYHIRCYHIISYHIALLLFESFRIMSMQRRI